MTTLLAAVGLVPEGPLHPELAATGLVAGVAAAVVAGRDHARWLGLVALAFVGVVIAAQGDVLTSGFLDRPDPMVVVSAAAVAVAGGAVARPRWSSAVVVAVGGCAGVWLVVPDTEVALLAGALLCGAALPRLLPGWLPDHRRRVHSALLLLPIAAAAAGSIGRPARFGPGLGAGVVAAAGLLGVLAGARRIGGGQRAGTPTTVAPAATSSTTTAPAPTTAS